MASFGGVALGLVGDLAGRGELASAASATAA